MAAETRVAIKEFFVRDFCNRNEATGTISIGTQSKKPLFDKFRAKFITEAKVQCEMKQPGIVCFFRKTAQPIM